MAEHGSGVGRALKGQLVVIEVLQLEDAFKHKRKRGISTIQVDNVTQN